MILLLIFNSPKSAYIILAYYITFILLLQLIYNKFIMRIKSRKKKK